MAAMAVVPGTLLSAALILYSAVRTAEIAILLLLLTAVVTVGIGAYFTRLITHPIQSLASTAQEIAAGNLDQQFEVKNQDEIATLSIALNAVTTRARESIYNLESLIAERAEELVRTNQQLKAEVAERQRVEDELQLHARELARSNADLEQFAYVASHDLQEPLRAIAGFTRIIARRYQGKLDPQADDFMERTLNATTRMQTLIQELLRYSRVGRQGTRLTPIEVDFILSQELENLQAATERNGARITRDALPTVIVDPGLLALVFRNLLSNAIKFHGETPPHVHVSAKREGGAWIFSVKDNGIGVDPQYADRIFTIFQRLHGRTEYPGTGLGLAICKKAAEYMGGKIWVESSPGNGSTFSFTIPVDPQEHRELDEPIAEDQPEREGGREPEDPVRQRARQLI